MVSTGDLVADSKESQVARVGYGRLPGGSDICTGESIPGRGNSMSRAAEFVLGVRRRM